MDEVGVRLPVGPKFLEILRNPIFLRRLDAQFGLPAFVYFWQAESKQAVFFAGFGFFHFHFLRQKNGS